MPKIKFSYPRGNFPRLCLIGNSNVGKSSITREILSHPKWYKSKIGKTAGSTVRLTIINDPKLNYHVIDLPGFGRMVRLDRKAEGEVQDQILNYIELDHRNIFLMIIVVSIDRLDEELEKWYFQNPDTIPLTLELIQFIRNQDIPCVLVLNKIDKLNSFQIKQVKNKLKQVMDDFELPYANEITEDEKVLHILETSAKKNIGIKELKQFIHRKAQNLNLNEYDPRKKLMDLPPINQQKQK